MKKSGTTITKDELSGSMNVSELFSKYFSIGVVCNDAGAAEIISEILLTLRDSHEIEIYAQGPALHIFQKIGLNTFSVSLNQLISNSQVVLTGTGWQTDLESNSIRLAKSAQKPCYVVLDHWQNYRIRFEDTDGTFTFPNKILVTNLLALEMVKREIPEAEVIEIPDLYIESILGRHSLSEKIEKSTSSPVLYLSDGQPYSITSTYSQTNQIQKLANLKKEIETLCRISLDELWIRPHPSDDANDNPPSEIGEISIVIRRGELFDQLANAPLIVGTDSMAMYVAMRLGRRTLTLIDESALPEWLDFCPTIAHMTGTMTNNPLRGTLLYDELSQFYLRDFSILDIDFLHLQNIDANIWAEDTLNQLGVHSFDVQNDNLRKFRTQGNHSMAIMNSRHQRIGLVTIRFKNFDNSLMISLFFYNKENQAELGTRVWAKLNSFLMQRFRHLKVASNISTHEKGIQGNLSPKV